MYISSLHEEITQKFKNLSDSPDLESEILICFCLNKPKIWFDLNKDLEIDNSKLVEINKLVDKRLLNIPLEHLTNQKYFYTNLFHVNEYTLIPRPETEILVDKAIEIIQNKLITQSNLTILEIGTGTGCIPISIITSLLEDSKLTSQDPVTLNFISTDISGEAIKVAKNNVKSLIDNINIRYESADSLTLKTQKGSLEINFKALCCDVTKPRDERDLDIFSSLGIDLLISNPPYIPSQNILDLPANVKKEPHIALDGGKEGIDIIKRIVEETKHMVIKNKTKYLIEIDSSSKEPLENFLGNISYKPKHYKFLNDLTGRIRFILIRF